MNEFDTLWVECLGLRAKLGSTKGTLALWYDERFVVGYAHYDDLVTLAYGNTSLEAITTYHRLLLDRLEQRRSELRAKLGDLG